MWTLVVAFVIWNGSEAVVNKTATYRFPNADTCIEKRDRINKDLSIKAFAECFGAPTADLF